MVKISGEMVGKKTKEKKLSFIIIQTGIMKEKKNKTKIPMMCLYVVIINRFVFFIILIEE